jgi:CelD/BcsL family acetyltransferase involved in cellulose biosynthesis
LTETATAGVEVTTARSFEELEPLRQPWAALQGTHFPTDFDAFRSILRHHPQTLRPHALLLARDGEPRTLALGRVEDVRLSAKVGYRDVYAPRVRVLTIVNEGVLGDADEEACRTLLGNLRGSLDAREADVLRLRNLRLDSPFHRIATSEPSRIARGYRTTPAVHWVLDVPDSYDAFLKGLSSSTREGVKRYGKKLTREHGDRLEVRVFRDVSELDELFEQVGRVAEKTYQGGLGVAFTGDEVQRDLTRLAMERGWFRAWVLSIDGVPVAFWHGEAYRGVFRIGVPGYDPAVGHLRVGNFVLMRLVEDLCADGDVQIVDFGFGDAEYKRRFGTLSWQEEDVLVYAVSAKGVRVNVGRSSVLFAAGVARRGLERTDALSRLKRWWRGRLRSEGD